MTAPEHDWLTIILAAGEGTRMRSPLPKALHRIAGRPMLEHVIDAARQGGSGALALVAGKGADSVVNTARSMAGEIEIFVQESRLGTAHAVLAAEAAIAAGPSGVLILNADCPLIQPQTLARLRAALSQAALAILGFRTRQPHGYGRIIEENGAVTAIREEADASEAERALDFCNSGIMALRGDLALPLLKAVGNDNAKGEYYLTDIVAIAHQRGLAVKALEAAEEEVVGVNSQRELARAESLWQTRRRDELMDQGVAMQQPESVMLSHDTQIGPGSHIEPNVWFGPGVSIGENVLVRAFSHLEGCRIENGAVIGPFARLRPGTLVGPGARIGNFCETKNARIDAGAKVNHLSYIGDASVGEKANIGAGTITCNYDGMRKHHTAIGAGAFIGSNSALVAPVEIGADAYVASGSVIVENVPQDALAIARGRQVNKPGYARKIRKGKP